MKDSDLSVLRQLELDVLHVYKVLPAVYARGSVPSILELSGYHRTRWIEYNQPNELALHETTNATAA